MKKKFTILLFVLLLTSLVSAQEISLANHGEDITIYYYYKNGCLDCVQQESFLDELEINYPEINIIRYDITRKESQGKLHKLAEEYGVESKIGIVPATFIEGEFFLGFTPQVARDIENIIKDGKTGPDEDNKTYLPII